MERIYKFFMIFLLCGMPWCGVDSQSYSAFVKSLEMEMQKHEPIIADIRKNIIGDSVTDENSVLPIFAIYREKGRFTKFLRQYLPKSDVSLYKHNPDSFFSNNFIKLKNCLTGGLSPQNLYLVELHTVISDNCMGWARKGIFPRESEARWFGGKDENISIGRNPKIRQLMAKKPGAKLFFLGNCHRFIIQLHNHELTCIIIDYEGQDYQEIPFSEINQIVDKMSLKEILCPEMPHWRLLI